ncbi:co-chaperone HscB [Shewanella litorisediminis]|uniref:Co-chaperone protein HscB homolog n=1 Tax=Shewanella litorisediminis TaxID=1173586 RepID=A0ABX7G6P0_9GAMM|nr:co-chaperone HscB [Shewanella litorisediminis]MCL2916801.1 co-chaperone HscB [Shewanella litorisediminis]QRH03032.1 co-chaperone HscB [Shewanella litorisediminis]
MNYFELFNLPVAFDINASELADTYRELQRTVHPDKFAAASEQEKLLAVSRTAMVNDGFQTLKDPIRRAEHMLALKGVDIRHETQTVRDTAFLMQQMEWREALEEIAHANDPHALIADLYQSFGDFQKQVTAKLKPLLISEDTNDWQSAADQVRKLKFMAKLHLELERAEDALLD